MINHDFHIPVKRAFNNFNNKCVTFPQDVYCIRALVRSSRGEDKEVSGFLMRCYPLGMVATITIISGKKYASNGFISVG